MSPLQPDDNVVNLQEAFDAAMSRLMIQQQALVLAEAQVLTLRKRLAAVEGVSDEGGVVFTD